MSRSTILDGNSFRPDAASSLSPRSRELVTRRERALGPAYRLFYREPLHLVQGRGTKLYDADGVEYLDAYNNVAGIGHTNPVVVEAVTRQMRQLNTHTRYLQDGILDYADQLLATLPDRIDRVMFVMTGSEANDLALRIAEYHTGCSGVIVTAEAYHGTTKLTAGASPAMGSGYPLSETVRVVPTPDTFRLGDAEIGQWMAAEVERAIDDLERDGIGFGAFLADTIFSSDGVFPDPAGYLANVREVVSRRGGVFIADEVQPGFGRTGDAMWGFQRHGVVPDIVTMGKSMGNGVPVAAMAISAEVLESFGREVPYFNTFGGNPVSIAAAQAVLDYIQEQDLTAHVARTGQLMRAGFDDLAARHPRIGDVRGRGLYWGIEIVGEAGGTDPDSDAALDLVNGLRERHVLISSAGPHNNVLKIRPPLVFDDGDVDILMTRLDDALTAATPNRN